MTLDEIQIANSLINHYNFIAIVARDELNNVKKFGDIIINTDKANQHGKHWIELKILEDKIFFFDSYAVAPPSYVINFAKKRNISKIIYNNIQLQNINSTQCGNYCIEMAKANVKNEQDFKKFILSMIRED